MKAEFDVGIASFINFVSFSVSRPSGISDCRWAGMLKWMQNRPDLFENSEVYIQWFI